MADAKPIDSAGAFGIPKWMMRKGTRYVCVFFLFNITFFVVISFSYHILYNVCFVFWCSRNIWFSFIYTIWVLVHYWNLGTVWLFLLRSLVACYFHFQLFFKSWRLPCYTYKIFAEAYWCCTCFYAFSSFFYSWFPFSSTKGSKHTCASLTSMGMFTIIMVLLTEFFSGVDKCIYI